MSFTQHTQRDLVWLADERLDREAGVTHGFSTRFGGVSQGHLSSLNLGVNRGDDLESVRENFRRFCAALGADSRALVFSRQVHRDDVRTVTLADRGKGLYAPLDYEADGLITDIPGLPLTIFTADCIPILLYDPVRRVVGAAHGGWRGTALGIAAKTVRRMEECFGSRAADLLAAIGPGISQCCFETHSDVPDAMTAALGQEAEPFIQPLPAGKFKVDLKGLNGLWLEKAGLSPENISICPECTACRPDKYWSHRIVGDRRGSLAAVIQLL